MLGISLMALGQITSGSTIHEVRGLFVTAGFVVGIGMRYVRLSGTLTRTVTDFETLAYASWYGTTFYSVPGLLLIEYPQTASVVIAQYFNKKRGLANGIVFAGGGLGGAVTSFVINALIERLGTAWAYRVLGFITLTTGLPAAWLLKERTKIRTATLFVEW